MVYLIKGPHDDEASLVTGCQLLMMFIPRDNLNTATVAFHSLVHW